MPRKVRALIADLQKAGFRLAEGGKGPHRKFRHPEFGVRNLKWQRRCRCASLPRAAGSPCHPRRFRMKPEDHYLKFVRWSEQDALYDGYCPDLFPWGGVCHSKREQDAYAELSRLVRE